MRSSEVETPSLSYEVADVGSPTFVPSQRLLTAILLRAVRDFVTYRKAKKGTEQHKIAVDAAGWLFWDGLERMTMRFVCRQLDLDYKKVRTTTLQLTKQDLLRMVSPAEED